MAVLSSIALALVVVVPSSHAASLTCPHEMALVPPSSCVDRWEASLVAMQGDRELAVSPHFWPQGRAVVAVSRPDVVPQAHVSMSDAWWACHRAKKRLCRADEWITACRGPSKTLYPYGDEREANACIDTGRTEMLSKLYSGVAMYENANMNDPRINESPNTLGKTGEAAACTNGYGVHDMVGNVNEWVDDGFLHGGFYLDTKNPSLGEGCGYATKAHSNVYYDYSTGFRCCADATLEPSIFEDLLSLRLDWIGDLALAFADVASSPKKRIASLPK